jgi:lactoylglutathione lyase
MNAKEGGFSVFKLRCDHIHLKSNDIEATAKWYCDHLGAEITFEGSFRGAKVYYLSMGGMNFILSEPFAGEDTLPASINSRLGVDHFGFEVDNVDEVVETLRAQNVTIFEEPVDVRPGLRIAYIEGPENVRIELSQRD